MSRRLDPRWAARRQRLHERFEEVHPIRDASHFAYMRGPETELTEADVADLWAEAVADPAPSELEARNHVYVHVPFCKSICSFCNYERLRPSSPGLLKGWLARVLRSVETIGPRVAPMTFHSLYIGGGTPSTLPASMLDTLLTALDQNLTFAEGAGRHIELDPAVVSPSRIDVLKRHGFKRFSFGIQTLDADVNAHHNRGAQGAKLVESCFDQLYDKGLDRVTVDFLLGLDGTTPDQILGDLEHVLREKQPLSIDIFALVPTKKYVNQHFDGDQDAFWAHMAPFQDVVPRRLPELCKQYGYRLNEESGHRYTLKRIRESNSPHVLYSYSQLVSEQQRPLNLLGFGTSARSQIFRKAALQYFDPDGDFLTDDPAVYRGHLIDQETEIRTYLVHHLRDRHEVDLDTFRQIFGVTLEQAIPVQLAAWEAQGIAELSDTTVRLKPQSTLDRARTLLWLVPDPMLEYEVGRVIGMDLSLEGVEAMFHNVPIGTDLGPGWQFWGVRRGRVTLRDASRNRVVLRVAPPLKSGGTFRLVVEGGVPTDRPGQQALAETVKRTRLLLTRLHGRPNTGPQRRAS